MDGEAMVLRGLVDEGLVAGLDARRTGHGPVDLREVTGWTSGGVRALSALLDREDGVRVHPPRRSSFLELLRTAELAETWPLYRDVHRILAAARVPDRPEVRA
ncbi:hypothetical protein [Actinomycetospora cinnamomea]|uniref:Uncharacterized protein n=1 Tax=Actinomycetospora cinnamomea TaxID=663609 RepID=A0A2U1F3S5_9PSEU|nr:hypothetical protein [Actinomycetospora cinnamomea]PVZ06826.1 hypothetical protein C8D89_11219 [Actinomycetospora cinnamomea]